jgi:hypothetical protein
MAATAICAPAIVWAAGRSGDPPPPAAAPGGFCEALANLACPRNNGIGCFTEVATPGALAPTDELADALATIGTNLEAPGGTDPETADLRADPEFARSVNAVADLWATECVKGTVPRDASGP